MSTDLRTTDDSKWVGIISLFPEMFSALGHGIPGQAQKKGLLQLSCFNPRDYTHDKHQCVDDRPYGGGPGMVMKIQPLRDAIMAAKSQAGAPTKVIGLSPQGQVFDHAAAKQIACSDERLIFVCGRYEGIDERLIERDIDALWSLGDFVLSGGELAAMAMIDAIIRFIPGVLGHEESANQDSFCDGLLDYPHYTRPEVMGDQAVPNVLLSGDHQAIAHWRMQQALGRTWLHRPDLLKRCQLNKEQMTLLTQFINAYKKQQA